MEDSRVHPSNAGVKPCKLPTLSSYPTKTPTYTTFSFKNFSNQVDFHSEDKLPCKNTWYRDLKATHVRNRRLLDLPYGRPKCCSDVYNVVTDRQKLKKVQKYGLTRPVRTPCSELEVETRKTCETEEGTGEEPSEDTGTHMGGICFLGGEPSDSDTEEEEEDEYRYCSSGSVSECSGCSTIGGGTRRKRHKVVKKNWRDLLHVPGVEDCREMVAAEIKNHKLGYNSSLKLKKVF